MGPDGRPINQVGQSGFQAQGPASQGYSGAIQQGMQNAQSNYGQQQDYINMLRGQANGEGPSVAQHLLAQQTQANQQASASAIASQRGMNPAMQAKLILDQQANQNQQAAGQGALLRAQEMTQSRSLLGGALGQQGAQNIGMFGTAGGLQQGQDALGLGAQQINANTAMGNAQLKNQGLGMNAGVAGQNAATAGGLVGGLMNGLSGGLAGMGKGGGGSGAISPEQYAAVSLARGGEVPGRDVVQGDSPRNDTVNAHLSPHEIVLPLSVTQAEDAPERAKSFVEAIKGKAKKQSAGRKYANGGMVQGYSGGGEQGDGSTFFMGAVDDPFATLGIPPPAADATPPPSAGPTQPTLPPELASVHAPFTPPPASASPFHTGIQVAGAHSATPPPKAPPDPMAGIPGIGSLNKAATAEQAAIQQEGKARAAGYSDIAQRSSAAAQQGKIDAENAQQETQARVAEQDRRAKQIADVNPNHYWESLGTGGRITSAIGMILGGMGSGLTGGPNHAFEAIQNAIGRDIDAQKANIGKKENELHQYMEGTKDLQAAQHALAAQHWAVAASQIEAATAKMGSQTAMPAAAAAMAQAKQKQITETQAYVARMNDLKQQKMQLDMTEYHSQAMRALLGGLSGGGGFPRQVLEAPGFEHYRERAVDLPDGSVGFAADKEEANKSREAFSVVQRLKPKLQRYMETLNSGNPETTDSGTAQEQYADLLSEMGHLHDLNRLTDVDLHLFQKQIPDISKWASLKAFDRQKLQGVGKSLDDKVWAEVAKVTHRPSMSRPASG